MSNARNRSKNGLKSKKNDNQMLKFKLIKENHKKMQIELSNLVLWRSPITTIIYFIKELYFILINYIKSCLNYRKTVLSLILVSILISISYQIEGPHLPLLIFIYKKLFWYLYWVGLGIASSIGLGSGLHTFLLYLGPFIARVTLAAYECNSLNFPEPPYPDNIVCPNDKSTSSIVISLFSIMSKVRWESFMWGLGTAIGELPPYFMARAAALGNKRSVNDVNGDDDDEEDEIAELEELLKKDPTKLKFFDRLKLNVFRIINKVGFIGILLCASIPNPLFDLAGITCGHFLVPFWTFFGATMIGKAIIKMHLQKIFVIMLFSEGHMDKFVDMINYLPFIGTKFAPLFQQFLEKEKLKLHSSNESNVVVNESLLSWIMGKFVLGMIIFFIVSIINSLAQKHAKRIYGKAQKD